MATPVLKVKFCGDGGRLPVYGTAGSVGLDVFAAEARNIEPGDRVLIRTGIGISPPPGTYGQLFSRSSLALRGVDVCAGTIDPDFTGEVKVLLANSGPLPVFIAPGDRIAQLVFLKFERPVCQLVDDLQPTDRGAGGFGSTGQ
ncbi:dUTPase [Mastadenovirus porcusquartum]|uniref:dUTP diphosphatase n=1 Tax=Mastadenovirus porcusquartum TaxID=3241439 RepID=A0A5P9VI22_9ADEN|nr:dUTPase [Porcine mastadenovirus B]QFX65733.1 dUTPase [Porcine mastadenovirus B]